MWKKKEYSKVSHPEEVFEKIKEIYFSTFKAPAISVLYM